MLLRNMSIRKGKKKFYLKAKAQQSSRYRNLDFTRIFPCEDVYVNYIYIYIFIYIYIYACMYVYI